MTKKELTDKEKYELAKNEQNFKAANQLIKATDFLNASGIRTFCGLMSIRSPGEELIETSIRDIEKMAGIGHGGKNWKIVEEILDQFLSTKLFLNVPASDLDTWKGKVPDNRIIKVEGTLITTCSVDPISQKLQVRINSDFTQFLDDVNNHYTWIFFEDISLIRQSYYGARVYQWIRMHLAGKDYFKNFVWYFNSESDEEPGVRQFLGIPEGKYKRSRDLYKRVIDPTFEKLNTVLSHRLHVDYEPFRDRVTKRLCGVKIKTITWNQNNAVRIAKDAEDTDKNSNNQVLYAPSVDRADAERVAKRVISLINSFGTNFRTRKTVVTLVSELLLEEFSEIDVLVGVYKGCIYFRSWAPENITPKILLSKGNFEENFGRSISSLTGEWNGPERSNYLFLMDDEFHAFKHDFESQEAQGSDDRKVDIPDDIPDDIENISREMESLW